MPRSRRCRCSPCRWRSAVAWRSRSGEGSVPARRGRSWRRRFCRRRRWTGYYTTKTRVWTAKVPCCRFFSALAVLDGGGPCAVTPAGSKLGVPDDQIRRLRGLWSRTAVSGRRGGRRVTPLPFPTTRSSSSKPVKRSGLWWTRGLPPVEDRDRRGTTWRTGRRACGCRPYPCVIRSAPPDPAWDLRTARGRAIDLLLWFT